MALKVYSEATLGKNKPKIAMPSGLMLRDHLKQSRTKDDGVIYEFVGADSFGSQWNERRRYEVDAGRDEVPILYTPLYDIVTDANLPRNIPIYSIGPGSVVMKEIKEGGEVEFMTIGSSERSIAMHHYAAGLEYSKDLVMYNELWTVPIAERAVGQAYNAILNHVHLYPIVSYAYAAANQTAGVTTGATLVEDYVLTIEAAITASKTDETNPRRGPYWLVVSGTDEIMVGKALKPEIQRGLQQQSDALGSIRGVIVYDGWTGMMGKLATTYTGVTAGKAYLVSQQYRAKDFQSFMKQDLMQDGMDEDITRFLMQIVWDTYFTAYANPVAAVEEITWPVIVE
jgi:hypothetical protein